jgi:predicted kinase
MKLIVLVGLPGAGKSTWAKNYVKNHPEQKVHILSSDEIRKDITGSYENFQAETEVWNSFDYTLNQLSHEKNYDVVIADATHLSISRRIRTLTAGNYEKRKIVYIATSLPKCIKRASHRKSKVVPESSMIYYARRFEEISDEELQIVDDYTIVTK